MALPSAGMGLPLYELFMENCSLSLGRLLAGMKGKGCAATATNPDLRQARANSRRYHIRAPSEYNAVRRPLNRPVSEGCSLSARWGGIFEALHCASHTRGRPP